MMHIQDDFENTGASLLHHSPLPTLDVVLIELISEETRQKTRRVHSTDLITATTPSTVMATNVTIISKKVIKFLIVASKRLRMQEMLKKQRHVPLFLKLFLLHLSVH